MNTGRIRIPASGIPADELLARDGSIWRLGCQH